MKKIFMLAFAMLLAVTIWANPITIINNTCAPINFALHVTPPTGGTSADGFKVLHPGQNVTYSSPSDFFSDFTVTNLNNTIPLTLWASSNFTWIRFWDLITGMVTTIVPGSVGSATFPLPCSGVPYHYTWIGNTVIVN